MRKQLKLISTGLSAAFLLSACAAIQTGQQIADGEPVRGSINGALNLAQGWTWDTQEAFYFENQGSRVMPYAWFLALEQADSSQPFRSNANIEAFRYLPAAPSDLNPDGLPVGFAKDVDSNGTAWMGLTCAACHTTEVHYNGHKLRIDGGPTLADFETFNERLVEAMRATLKDQPKFARFALAVLGRGASGEAQAALRKGLSDQTRALARRNKQDRPNDKQPRYGFARLDAIGAIFNKVMVDFAGVPSNARPADAPASYPFIWGTHQSDVVQWTGFAPNGPATVGALIRNGGEVMGVYGALDMPSDTSKRTYNSSLAIENLGALEAWVAELRSPVWPEAFLPPIDQAKAATGKALYAEHCAACHQVIPRDREGENYKAVLTPITQVGTDPREYQNMNRVLDSGKFAGRREASIAGDKIGPTTTGLNPLVNSVAGSLLKHPVKTAVAIATQIEGGLEARAADSPDASADSNKFNEQVRAYLDKFRQQNDTDDVGKYKARPLNGIWATAPYLHNGSVPNLYELLLAPAERSKTFYVGSRNLDVKRVGLVSTQADNPPGAFVLDTSLPGNSNSGHLYGTTLDDADKWALVEYMKTL